MRHPRASTRVLKNAERRCIRRIALCALAAAAAITVTACAGAPGESAAGASGGEESRIADLQIVDCLLPGMLRQLGNTQYLTQRRPTRTTAADCRIRGGEYTAYDRASLKSSLEVWMPAAEAGDVEAMANVGEIFERGLGDEPNYEAAAVWYERAANAGNSRAQFNLGTLYEQGLGVPKDRVVALNWYRRAWGMEADDLVFQSVAATEYAAERAELESQISLRENRIARLEESLASTKSSLQAQQQQATGDSQTIASMEQEIDDLELWIEALESEREVAEERLAAVPRLRTPGGATTVLESDGSEDIVAESGLNFGRYFALVIGNQDYTKIDPLETPINDATKVAEVLNQKYGFSVQLLLNANNVEAMEAINDLYARLGEDDNLLIYYAGHGARIPSGQIENGYWLPVNADAPPRDTFWVSNEFITGHLSRIPAKRVLVIADSCYAGLLSNSPGYLIVKDAPQYTDEFMRYKLPKRSRLLLSSGGDRPVLDKGTPEHSVFASVLLDTLRNNNAILSGPQLFSAIDAKMRARAAATGFQQQAEYKVIKGAGHEVGDFFLVPATRG